VCRLARAHGVALADSVADQVFEWLRSETQRQPVRACMPTPNGSCSVDRS
jgi:hypothetical protein